MDGETINGNAVYATIRRDTETWRSFIEYSQLSDGFRSDLGFITTNNQKKYTLWHSYNQYPNKDFIKKQGDLDMIIETINAGLDF